jgi:hypothetical protein
VQKKENKNIMNIFLDNIRERKAEIIQRRELPNIPVIPALLNKLPDAINNIIFYYVGYRSKVATQVTIEYISRGLSFSCIRQKQIKIASYIANIHFQLENIRTMEKRREVFIEMPCWVQKYILGTWFKYLFPRDRKEYFKYNLKLQEDLERKYKIQEGSLIRGFTQYSKDYVYSYSLIQNKNNENGQCDFI